MPEPVAKYLIPSGIHAIYDFNNDGYDDVYEGMKRIIYGGSDLAKLTHSETGQVPAEFGYIASIYKTPQGEFYHAAP